MADDRWFTASDPNYPGALNDGIVYGADGDAVCECHDGFIGSEVVRCDQRAERIAKLPRLEYQAGLAVLMLQKIEAVAKRQKDLDDANELLDDIRVIAVKYLQGD